MFEYFGVLVCVICRLMQHNTDRLYMHYVNCIYIDSRQITYDIDYVQVSKATYYKQCIRKSIQTMYFITKYTFKLMLSVEIYKVNHYEIVFVSRGFKLIRALMRNTSR